jgi:magnesium chelatase family protein
MDIVGLPDSTVRESKERVRVAIRNSGFKFPAERIVVNLAPAGIKKEGASFDLPIALAILAASGQVPVNNRSKIMVLGELNLSGIVRPINGVLSAVGSGLENGISLFLVPSENLNEALSLNKGKIMGISSLKEASEVLRFPEYKPPENPVKKIQNSDTGMFYEQYGDLSDIKGHEVLKRAMEITASGRHNLFLFGPPGSGKTMAVKRLPTLFPPLNKDDSLEITKIYSASGLLEESSGLISMRPFRMPHHSASHEGLIGGGKYARPGEVTLAHKGILFLDEAPEFRQNLLQGLREPIESRRVTIVRAEKNVQYPADLQLVMTANPCPCGNLGRDERVCYCTAREVQYYWKRLGNALLDRIDIRVPVKPVTVEQITGKKGETSEQVRDRVTAVIEIQEKRFKDCSFKWNAHVPPGLIEKFCYMDNDCLMILAKATKKLSLSSRACHSIIKVARTIADLDGSESIKKVHILEAVQHRRYGEEDVFWSYG